MSILGKVCRITRQPASREENGCCRSKKTGTSVHPSPTLFYAFSFSRQACLTGLTCFPCTSVPVKETVRVSRDASGSGYQLMNATQTPGHHCTTLAGTSDVSFIHLSQLSSASLQHGIVGLLLVSSFRYGELDVVKVLVEEGSAAFGIQ